MMNGDAFLRTALFVTFTLVIPITIGMSAYLWSMNKNKYIKASTLFVAPAVFFISSLAYWNIQAKAIKAAGGYACGAFGAVAVSTTTFGTVMHFVLGTVLFSVTLFAWNRKQNNLKA
jgi:chromate transport protein ChrA